jgi:hypothetical protein
VDKVKPRKAVFIFMPGILFALTGSGIVGALRMVIMLSRSYQQAPHLLCAVRHLSDPDALHRAL